MGTASKFDKVEQSAKEELLTGSFVDEERLGRHQRCKHAANHMSLSDVISLFTVIAIIALVRSIFFSGVSSAESPSGRACSLSNSQKASKILSEVPLIGEPGGA